MSTLLEACERRARDLSAHSARLDTIGWQAEEFYARHSYEAFAQLGCCRPGHDRGLMNKRLA